MKIKVTYQEHQTVCLFDDLVRLLCQSGIQFNIRPMVRNTYVLSSCDANSELELLLEAIE